jgi:hypothetical protein
MFLEFRKNNYSQNGEDGVLEKITNLLELNNLELCEFGAWDGIQGSNTFNLLKKYNAKCVYIEGDKKKYASLLKTTEKNPNITPINTYIDVSQNKLDNVLSKTFLKKNFDILSIDIDSNDLDVWESLENYQPKIVVIEINSSIKPGILQKHSLEHQGNSFSSTISVGKKKMYTAVCHTGNLIFVKNEYIDKLNFPKDLINDPKKLFINDWVNEKNNFLIKLIRWFLPEKLLHLIPSKIKVFIKKLL